MANRPAPFTQADIKRAVCALLSAGVKVCGLRVDAGGFTVLTEPVSPASPPGEAVIDMAIVMERLRRKDGAS
jgi:hypothetical protein